MFVWATLSFAEVEAVEQVVVVAPDGWEEMAREALGRAGVGDRVSDIVAGGGERPASVLAGLAAVKEDVELIAIHDGARPLVTAELIERCLAAAEEHGAALACAASSDTLKQVDGERQVVVATLDRRGIWQAQTPQVFQREIIAAAYERAGMAPEDVTDDCMLVEAMGIAPAVVESLTSNMKVTTAEDLAVAEALLRARGKGGL
jgi:2-C-methyl-D-erythritol 4-phosphate cytidylyltransferase